MSAGEILSSLLPDDVKNWLESKLLEMRSKNGYCTLELKIQDGYVITYHERLSHKVSDRSRIRTKGN